MKTLKQWFKDFLPLSWRRKKFDLVDETLDESFPASDAPAWTTGETQHSAFAEETTTHPLAVLKEEHRALMQVIYLIHEQLELLQQNQPVPLSILKNIHAFLEQVVEKSHHQKEEKLLLPALEKSGAPLATCPLALLKQDHETSLVLLTTLKNILPAYEKNETLSREKLIATLKDLKDIYTRHTLKEENFIFPLAEKYLSPAMQKSLSAAFDKMDGKN